MKIFYRRRGAISVFLTLILLPTLVFGGMVTDAARIFGSKSLVSGAGELAMNAGLSQYDTQLKDAYGLMVMEKPPEAMQEELEQYFISTIRSSGLDGADEVSSLIDLRCDSGFHVYNVDGSQIYMTDVEKQQILEYMKYRAPVCMGEDLWEKLMEIRDSKKQVEATSAQLDFADSMEDLQEACENANKALSDYVSAAETFPQPPLSNENINGTIMDVKTDLEEATVYLFMAATIDQYGEFGQYDASADQLESVERFNRKANELKGYTDDTLIEHYEACLACLYEMKSVPVEDFGLEAWVDEQIELAKAEGMDEKVAETYRMYQRNRILVAGYVQSVDNMALKYLQAAGDRIVAWHDKISTACACSEEALMKLEELKQKMNGSREEYGEWNDAIDDLPKGEMKNGMHTEAGRYSDFLDEEKLDDIIHKLQRNRDWMYQAAGTLEKTAYCGEKLYNPDLQLEPFLEAAPGADYFFTDPDRISGAAQRFVDENYHKEMLPGDTDFTANVGNDPFYQELREHCQAQPETEQSQRDKNTTESLLNRSGNSSLEEINKLSDADWESVSGKVPSEVLRQAYNDEETTGYNSQGGGTDRKGRKTAIANAKKSMNGIAGFLDDLEKLLEDGLENLYIMEYGIQMFSYFTVNKDSDGKAIEGAIPSLSDDDLTKHMQYRSEVEYILWGNKSAQENVKNTRLLLYGIRMLFNVVYSFSDPQIMAFSTSMAAAMSCGVPFLVPVFSVLVKIAVAWAETTLDVEDLMAGKSVPFLKKATNSQIAAELGIPQSGRPDTGVKLNYKDYLSVFLLVRTFGSAEKKTLARIADCIQLNTKMNIIDGYTMLAVSAEVEAKTTFLKKAAALPDGGSGKNVSDRYRITYKSLLGY